MMTCGGSSFRVGNNYIDGSYLGPPPIELKYDYSTCNLYIIPRYINYRNNVVANKSIRLETKPNHTSYRNRINRKSSRYNYTRAFHGSSNVNKRGVHNSTWSFNTQITCDALDTIPSKFGSHIKLACSVRETDAYWYVRATYRIANNTAYAGSRYHISSNLVRVHYPGSYLY